MSKKPKFHRLHPNSYGWLAEYPPALPRSVCGVVGKDFFLALHTTGEHCKRCYPDYPMGRHS